LTLPSGFCATLVADSLATPRQMDVAPNGDLFVALRGRAASNGNAAIPGGVMVIRGAKRVKIGSFAASTVKLVGEQLYTETGSAILRYHWVPGQMQAHGPDTIVAGLPGDRSHTAKTFAIRGNDIFVNHGSPTNSCQEADRSPGSKGKDPCPDLATRGGIWRYDRNRTGQTLASGEHFVTGTRNIVAIAFKGDMLYGVQHGRDQLSNNWPALFTDAKSAENPGEEMFQLTKGSDLSTAATAARLAAARTRRETSATSPATGHRTASCSTRGECSLPNTRKALSLYSTGRGIARPSRRLGSRSSSSR
jgi:hypothetical protein